MENGIQSRRDGTDRPSIFFVFWHLLNSCQDDAAVYLSRELDE